MKGHIRQRSEGTWTIVIDIGRKLDPKTGLSKRVQKWKTVRGTKKEAQAELNTMLHNLQHGQVISPSKMAFGEWLDEWLNSAIQPHRRMRSYETYQRQTRKIIAWMIQAKEEIRWQPTQQVSLVQAACLGNSAKYFPHS